jgi:hypothetical protein
MIAIRTITIFLIASICVVGQQSITQYRLAESLQRKLDHIRENAQLAHRDQTPTIMTEDEVNDYIAAGRLKLPPGVKKLTFQGESGVLTAMASIDFEEILIGQHSSSPLLSIFSGTRDVRVEADASGAAGQGSVRVRTVTLDGIEVPRMALEFFLSKYVTPKHPNVGMDSVFPLPDRIDTATIGYHKLTVTQN